uniref:Uncharacterized protein n=1 Tax=Candidatus Berkiella aquae TaxID=295108 RepID=A0A0Q9YWW1_9GAMM
MHTQMDCHAKDGANFVGNSQRQATKEIENTVKSSHMHRTTKSLLPLLR